METLPGFWYYKILGDAAAAAREKTSDWLRAGASVSEYSSESSSGAARLQRSSRSSTSLTVASSASASLLPGQTRRPIEYGMNLHASLPPAPPALSLDSWSGLGVGLTVTLTLTRRLSARANPNPKPEANPEALPLTLTLTLANLLQPTLWPEGGRL